MFNDLRLFNTIENVSIPTLTYRAAVSGYQKNDTGRGTEILNRLGPWKFQWWVKITNIVAHSAIRRGAHDSLALFASVPILQY